MTLTKAKRKKLSESLSAKGREDIASSKKITVSTVNKIIAGTIKEDKHGVIDAAIEKALAEKKARDSKSAKAEQLIDHLG